MPGRRTSSGGPQWQPVDWLTACFASLPETARKHGGQQEVGRRKGGKGDCQVKDFSSGLQHTAEVKH